MLSPGDPAGSGLVKSFARPGGSVIGTLNPLTDIAPKHLDLLHELTPRLSRLEVLTNPLYKTHRDALKIIQTLAPRIGVGVLPIEMKSAQDIENGFSLMAREKVDAAGVVTDPIFTDRRRQIAELAMKGRLPCMGYSPEFELVVNLKTAKALGLTIPPLILLRADRLIE